MRRAPGTGLPALLAAAAACAVAAPARAQTVAPVAVQKADVEERLGAPVPLGLTFRDETGGPVRFADLFDGSTSGVPVVLVLAYYRCPALCGLVQRGAMSALAQVDLELGRDYRAVTVSFDPDDTPATAAAAKASAIHDVDRPAWAGRWPFLLADPRSPEAIAALADAVGFRYGYDADTKQFAHPSVVFVLTPDGRVSRYLYGVQFRPRDLKLALLEAGEGRIGSFFERVLLTCYRYDPATRRYGFTIMAFLRIGALCIFVVVASFLAILWRRDRRRYAELEPEPSDEPIAAARVVTLDASVADAGTGDPPRPRSPA